MSGTIFEGGSPSTYENPLVQNTGCTVTVTHEFLQITLDEIQAYKDAGVPQPVSIYIAWDERNRALLSGVSIKQPYFFRFEIEDDGTGNAVLSYTIPELEDAEILGVSVEGQGLNESDSAIVSINVSTGQVVFGNVSVGQQVKIDYKK